ncbi:PAS domain-containing sensor histidine kinase [Halosegnis marinus]|uniref:histidine kinase n=1 Tax=Halosegnis marinus TaxID=3034023 RepID=A0ABD5ZQE2_9EURY|nr:PAS domain S-box protein [Halosegnis sp. DT85]
MAEKEHDAAAAPDAAAALVATLPDAVVTIDTEGTIRYVNDAFGDLLGYDTEAVVGEPVTEIVPGGLEPRHDRAFERYLETGERTIDWSGVEFPARHASGHEVPVSVSFTEVTDRDERLFAGVVRDVSDRVETRAALRRNEAMFRTLAERIDAVVWVYDLHEERYAYVSPEFETLWGRPRSFLYDVDGLDEVAATVHEDDREAVAEVFRAVVRADDRDGDVPDEHEYRVVRPDGSVRWVRDSPALVTDDTGPARVVGVATDVTAYKDREARLQEHTETLRADNEQLDEFASVVSHDLRSPLSVAAGRVELAREAHPDDDHLDAAAAALDRVESLVGGMLDGLRADRGAQDTEPVSLTAVAREAWTTTAVEGDLVVEGEYTLEADPVRLRQLFQNLYTNAAEHAGPEPTVTVGPAEEGFYVEDDGSGIPEPERESVFEMGYGDEGGTGFGLAIVRRVARRHGWRVSVEDADPGARFVFEPA